jgi:hypothetical protein
MDDIFRGVGVEVTLIKPDDFLKVRETLTRIGVAAKNENTLYQSCHVLHKQGRYAIVHFKELFILDGKPSSIVDNDVARRNTITRLLSEWGLVLLVDIEFLNPPTIFAPLSQIKIIAFKDKQNWDLVPKYSIGRRIDQE